MRSIEFELDQEHRGRLGDCLRKDTIQLGAEAEAAFAGNIEASIDVFQEQKSILEVTHRQKHDALRAVWQLVWEDDVSAGQLRARLCGLPKQVTEFLQARARQMIPELADVAGYDFSQWVRDADPESLKNVVRLLSADGAKPVTRSRGPGKRSSARLEPLIFGNARGAPEEAPEGGRPRHDARDALVMYLAIDWLLATDAKPSPGRSDQTGFGDLVHCVFQWIDEPSPPPGSPPLLGGSQKRSISACVKGLVAIVSAGVGFLPAPITDAGYRMAQITWCHAFVLLRPFVFPAQPALERFRRGDNSAQAAGPPSRPRSRTEGPGIPHCWCRASRRGFAAAFRQRGYPMTAPKPTPTPRLLSVATVALRLAVSEKTIRRLVQDGRLLSHRVGRQIRISESDLATFLAQSRSV